MQRTETLQYPATPPTLCSPTQGRDAATAPGGFGQMTVYVKAPYLREVPLPVCATVVKLKGALAVVTAVSVGRQELRFAGRILHDEELVSLLQTTPYSYIALREIPIDLGESSFPTPHSLLLTPTSNASCISLLQSTPRMGYQQQQPSPMQLHQQQRYSILTGSSFCSEASALGSPPDAVSVSPAPQPVSPIIHPPLPPAVRPVVSLVDPLMDTVAQQNVEETPELAKVSSSQGLGGGSGVWPGSSATLLSERTPSTAPNTPPRERTPKSPEILRTPPPSVLRNKSESELEKQAKKRRTAPMGIAPVVPKTSPKTIPQDEALKISALMGKWMGAGFKSCPFRAEVNTAAGMGDVGFAVGLAGGQLLWRNLQEELGSPSVACEGAVSVVGDEGCVIVGLSEELRCWNLKTQEWAWKTSVGPHTLLSAGGGNIIHGTDTNLSLTSSKPPHNTISLGEPAGSNKWLHACVDAHYAAAIDTGNNFFVWSATNAPGRGDIVGQHSSNHSKRLWADSSNETVKRLFLVNGLVCMQKGGASSKRTIQIWEAERGNNITQMRVDSELDVLAMDVLAFGQEVLVTLCDSKRLFMARIDRKTGRGIETAEAQIPKLAGKCTQLKFAGPLHLVSFHENTTFSWSPSFLRTKLSDSMVPSSSKNPSFSKPNPSKEKCCIM